MANAENHSFKIGQVGVPMPIRLRTKISSTYHAKTPEQQARQLAGILNLTEEQRANSRRNIDQTGKPKTKEYLRKRSTVWNIIMPLVLRDALIPEMVALTQLTTMQVANALHHSSSPERSAVLSQYLAPEKDKERRSKSHQRGSRSVDRSQISLDEERRNELARALLDAGLITDDVSSWKNLQNIYADAGRELPKNLADKIRLEIFLKAKKSSDEGDSSLMEQYVRLGMSIDADWFGSSLEGDIDFLRTSECKHHWVLGNPKDGTVHGNCLKCGKHKKYEKEKPAESYNGVPKSKLKKVEELT